MEDLKPSSREEAVLAKIAGIEDPMVDAFEPSSREEWFMNKIAEKMAEGGGGSGGGVMIVNLQLVREGGDRSYVCDKTAGEMMQAMESKTIVLVLNDPIAPAYAPIISAIKTNKYRFETFLLGGQNIVFIANAESDYPYYVIPK